VPDVPVLDAAPTSSASDHHKSQSVLNGDANGDSHLQESVDISSEGLQQGTELRKALLYMRTVGNGRGGTVYKALHMELLRIFAVKQVEVMSFA
jgi:hypothetical protein